MFVYHYCNNFPKAKMFCGKIIIYQHLYYVQESWCHIQTVLIKRIVNNEPLLSINSSECLLGSTQLNQSVAANRM